jgi:hypothetical protein
MLQPLISLNESRPIWFQRRHPELSVARGISQKELVIKADKQLKCLLEVTGMGIIDCLKNKMANAGIHEICSRCYF